MSLAHDLASFDGKHVGTLEPILEAHDVNDLLSDELIALASDPDEKLQIGATWLMKAAFERGGRLGAKDVASLCRSLERIVAPDARLHVSQSIGHLTIPSRNAEQLARFLRDGIATDHKFLRAWSYDGFHRLAKQHARFREERQRLMDQGRHDAAASVRARLRAIDRER